MIYTRSKANLTQATQGETKKTDTERKRLAKESHHLQRLEGLGVLAGGIAHDFNNVLTGILGNISIARITADPGSKVQEALLNAEKSCQVASGLVQKLLPFAHSGAPVKALVPMKIFIRESLRSYEFPPSIQLRFSLEDDLWDAELDGGQVKNVLISLVDNSVHACPEGGVIELAGKNVIVGEGGPGNLAPGPYVRLTITDTGRGIAEEDRERIFDPYFTTKDGSNGLGLAFAFSVLKRHSGSITVRSLPGSGAAFDLFLPAKAEIEQESSPVPDRVGERKGSRAGKGRKSVLIMDDEKDILETAGQMIAIMGNSVSTARDGEEAISRYRESLDEGRPFDAVILDLRVPGGMGGRETMEKLRVIDPGVTAWVSSGYSGDPIMSEYGRYGFKAAVAKPYSSDDLKRVLEKVLEE
ncbi:MAG: ATP-binding protein [bacterium]|nr:ATP-binding protein [bacterium]MDT8285260.1 ATP-binding protein [Thermovirgaceae bacterium]